MNQKVYKITYIKNGKQETQLSIKVGNVFHAIGSFVLTEDRQVNENYVINIEDTGKLTPRDIMG